MADYWKSQDRKYCDFCKCWIADNRPSIDFHEKGRRHQENVKKRLTAISKKSAREQKETEKFDIALKQMEAAALEAYRKDVENNADLTSMAINKKVEEENLTISNNSKKVWHEVKSSDGQIYYWNTITSETKWEAPSEGYLSLAEQKDQLSSEYLNQVKTLEKQRKKEELSQIQKKQQQEAEERAWQAREKMKERRVTEDIEPIVYGPLLETGPVNPYGKWQVVESKPQIDLQLPEKPEYVEVELPPEPVIREFKEKTVESLGDFDGSVTFKKRKFAGNMKKNTRQRVDND